MIRQITKNQNLKIFCSNFFLNNEISYSKSNYNTSQRNRKNLQNTKISRVVVFYKINYFYFRTD